MGRLGRMGRLQCVQFFAGEVIAWGLRRGLLRAARSLGRPRPYSPGLSGAILMSRLCVGQNSDCTGRTAGAQESGGYGQGMGSAP